MMSVFHKVNNVVVNKAPRGFFKDNRKRFVDALRHKLRLDSGYVLLKGPIEQPVYDDDNEFLLTAESNFAYLFGIDEPETWGLIDLESGCSTLLLHEVSPERSYWMKVKSLDDFRAQFDGEAVSKIDSLAQIIGLTEENKESYDKKVYVLKGTNKFTNGEVHVPSQKEVGELCSKQLSPNDQIYFTLSELRKEKSEEEIKLMEQAVSVTLQVAEALTAFIKEGKSELQIGHHFQALSMYFGNFYASFPPVVQLPKNAHKNFHNSSNITTAKSGDLIILHLGLRVEGVTSKLIKTVPVSGQMTEVQLKVYQSVKGLFDELKTKITQYRQFVELLEDKLADLLIHLGAIKGEKKQLIHSDLIKKFYERDVLSYIGFDVVDPLTVELRKGEKEGELSGRNALFFKLAVVFDGELVDESGTVNTEWLKETSKVVPAIKMGEIVFVTK